MNARRRNKGAAETHCSDPRPEFWNEYLAEGVRFELTVPLPTRRISSPVHSTALPTFRAVAAGGAGRAKS